MAETEVLMPRMGESVNEATIIKWVKNEGDSIKADETLIEIATDKVDSEIPAPIDGILLKKLCKDGDVVAVGKAIAVISSGGNGAVPSATQAGQANENKPVSVPEPKAEESIQENRNAASSVTIPRLSASGKFYSPL